MNHICFFLHNEISQKTFQKWLFIIVNLLWNEVKGNWGQLVIKIKLLKNYLVVTNLLSLASTPWLPQFLFFSNVANNHQCYWCISYQPNITFTRFRFLPDSDFYQIQVSTRFRFLPDSGFYQIQVSTRFTFLIPELQLCIKSYISFLKRKVQ